MVCETAVILAAGAGTRMKSDLPKVLHRICGKPILAYVIEQVKAAGIQEIVLVVGHGAQEVEAEISRRYQKDPNIKFVLQQEQLGTGHAVMQAKDLIKETGNVIVLCGDTPLISTQSIQAFAQAHKEQGNAATVLTASLDRPFGYGRIIRNQQGQVKSIVEEKDASPDQKLIREVNSGMYCFRGSLLRQNLDRLSTNNSQREYYLTDVLTIAVADGEQAGAYCIDDPIEILGINTRVQQAEAEVAMRSRINEAHMLAGVTMIDPAQTYIEPGVTIGTDTELWPGVILSGHTVIGTGCTIGQNSRLVNAIVGDHVEIQSSVITDSSIGSHTTVGPYAYLRPGSRIGSHVKIGDFVEVKNAVIGDHSKASHLAYVGDADVGQHVNIGCGVVFVNYDGKNKARTIVGDGAFIGSNSNLVAPVTVEEDAYVAAGTTVARDVPGGALCIGREKEKHIEGWVARKGLSRKPEGGSK